MESKLILTITNAADYERLNEFLKGTSIEAELISYITDSNHGINEQDLKTFKYLPTTAFKAFCGAENLNQNGYICLLSAYNLVLDYAYRNYLYFYTHIDLDNTLAEALNSDKHSILISDLLPTFVNLFKHA